MKTLKAACCLIGFVSFAQAQTVPPGPIRIIVADTPGVPNDLLARGLAPTLSKAFGVPVVAENRVGANGIIGTLACAKAAPDGQTLCSTDNRVISLNPALRAKLPYDPLRDLAGIANTGFLDSCLVVHVSVPVTSAKELIELSKMKPGTINWGHFGEASTGYLYEEYFKMRFGARFYPVPYKSPPQMYQALLARDVQAGVSIWPVMVPFVKAGKLKCLAITSSQRLPLLPDVPTFEEEGFKVPLRPWFGWHYPATIPKAMVIRMNAEIRKAAAEPAFKELMAKTGVQPAGDQSPEQFEAFTREQIRQMVEFIKVLGIKPIED